MAFDCVALINRKGVGAARHKEEPVVWTMNELGIDANV